MNLSYKKFILLSLVFLGIGFGAGYTIHKPTTFVTAHSIRENNNKYKFIHPLLAVDRPDGTLSAESQALHDIVEKFINQKLAEDSITDGSLFFIDYSGKHGSFGINEKSPYSPASLLKVVLMVAYLKEADSNPEILNKTFVYAPDIAKNLEIIPFDSPSRLTVGSTYNIDTLIKRMIIDSDNGAMNILIENIDTSYLNQVYTDLGLSAPKDNNNTYTISAKDYSLFFRILYNNTYLSSENSEKALSILAEATFPEGLMAGVPAGTVVANKFGEHINGKGDRIDSIELHDCGILYPPSNPYLLCVMTRGKDIKKLKETISGISKIIYLNMQK